MTKPKTRADTRPHVFKVIAPKCETRAVIPAGVTVKVCPGYVDARFVPDAGHVGEFAREWAQRRGGR